MSVRCIWCKQPKEVKLERQFMGLRFLHTCECGKKACVDITGKSWHQYSPEELEARGYEHVPD